MDSKTAPLTPADVEAMEPRNWTGCLRNCWATSYAPTIGGTPSTA